MRITSLFSKKGKRAVANYLRGIKIGGDGTAGIERAMERVRLQEKPKRGPGRPRKAEHEKMNEHKRSEQAVFLLAVSRGDEINGRTPTFQERIAAAKACAGSFAKKQPMRFVKL